MKLVRYILAILLFGGGLSSCKVAKKLPAGEKLYAGASVKIIKNDSLDSEKIPDLKEELLTLTRPLPNTTLPLPFLSQYPYKVGFYYFIGDVKSEKGLRAWFKKKLSEEPVFINSGLVDKNSENLQGILKSKGYFGANVVGVMKSKRTLASAEYTVTLNRRFEIDSIIFLGEEGKFGEDFLRATAKFKPGQYFDLAKLKQARVDVDKELRNEGYFYFKPDYVGIEADTTIKPQKVVLKVGPKPDIPTQAKRQFQINDIFVNIDTKTEVVSNSDPNSLDFFRGLILDDPTKKYKEAIFSDAIAFRPGTFFNNDLQAITNNRLIGLSNFKFIKSHYEVVNRLDSTLIDVYYNLQTNKRKSLRVEANAISRSSGLAGSQLSLNWQNINAFRGGEFFKLSLNGNFELQVGGNKANEYRDNYRLGADAQFNIPRFLAPFVKIDPEVSKVLPKTQIKLGYESFIKTGLYNLNSARASLNYAWTRGRGIEHSLRPIGVNLVKSSNISTVFIDEIFADPRLLIILENQFIAGGAYEITVSPKQYKRSNFSYRGSFDFAGNVFGLIDKIRNNPEKSGQIFGENFSQFARLENDFRYKYDINSTITWANRGIVGLGVPYGNSLQLPFVSQFFVGGNNSLRAFKARGVGPGTYEKKGNAAEEFLGNNTGDIKLEFNTELRFKFNSFLNTALFVDAGNVWMYKDQYIYDEGSLFSKNFYKELAVGTGIGFRFDFTFIIFRIDVATPVVKPWLPVGEKWVLKDIKPFDKPWRKDNVIWNFAVGLPF
ncbi:MAG TPA: BamA/TamA family outer membrane protein [Leadbetterella sp.]|nr:BamA/TamA family outer membrane protein [Leadbetterella sp.]